MDPFVGITVRGQFNETRIKRNYIRLEVNLGLFTASEARRLVYELEIKKTKNRQKKFGDLFVIVSFFFFPNGLGLFGYSLKNSKRAVLGKW